VTEESIDLRDPKPETSSTKMTEVVTTKVPRVGSVSPIPIGKEKVFDYDSFDRNGVQQGEGGDPVPVQEVGAQEFHQLELRMITEDRTVPVGGPPTPTTEATV
jgi:hypothetical protein